MIENKNWYAVYTRPRWEKKIASLLTRSNIENYCPLNKIVRQWSDRKKLVQEPLFTSYVFVRAAQNQLTLLKQTTGIINMVYWLGKPAVIRDQEIEIIKRFLNDYSNVKLEKTPININDNVQIISGPLIQLEGKVTALKSRTVKVLLPSLGYMMHAEIETNNLIVISQEKKEEFEYSNTIYAAK